MPAAERRRRSGLIQRRSNPLGDVGPALFARYFGDLATGGKALEVGQRKRGGLGDHAVHCEPPVGKAAGLMALEESLGGGVSLAKGDFEIMLRGKLAGQECA